MLFEDHLVVVRGGGDLATGAVRQLHHAGFPVVVLELGHPLAIRRTVAVASAITEGAITVDGIGARRVETEGEARALAAHGTVPVMVAPTIPNFGTSIAVVVDARLAKRNLDTTMDQARLVVALGPGFTAGVDCHAVVETMRGHRLGRVIWHGRAEPNTGIPGSVGGEAARRVVRAPGAGEVEWSISIGDSVTAGERLGAVGDEPVTALIGGVVRGLIAPGTSARPGLKIADVDPRADRSACFEISDKSRLVGAGVLEAVLTWLNRR
jgi:xanthine dehydrogenase accessory factor